MGQENTVPRKINKVEGAAGEVIISGGPDVLETWGAMAGGGDAVITVAADDTPAAQKDRADFTCPGANDEATIQALVAAGVTVKLMVGTYVFNDTLDIVVSNFRLEGSGMGTVIGGILAVPYIMIGDNATYIENVTICDLRIDGSNQTAGEGIFGDGGSVANRLENIQILNCRIENTDDEGIEAQFLYDSLIEGNFIDSSGSNSGINISGEHCRVVNNHLTDITGKGIYLNGCVNSVVEGNILQDISTRGIHLFNSDYSSAVGNVLRDVGLAGGSNIIWIESTDYATVTGNICDWGGYGIWTDSNYGTITGNYITVDWEGIVLDGCRNNAVADNVIANCIHEAISLREGSDFNTITGNSCSGSGDEGIKIYRSDANVITGNICEDSTTHGILVWQSDRNTITGNALISNVSAGISLDDSHKNVISGNNCFDNAYGIHLATSSNFNTIVGNVTQENDQQGIRIWTGNDNNVTGNVSDSNSQVADNTHANIYINGDRNLVEANLCRMGILANQPDYGVEIGSGTGNIVRNNDLYDSGLTGPINDLGVDTEFNNITFQFIQGTTFISSTGSAKGWEIDLAAEWAVALGQLPLELTQVVRIKIWAVGLAAPGAANAMRLEININAGQDDEAYTAEAIAIADKPNTTDNFGVDDIIHWLLTSADDADIGDLAGGDSLEVQVLHEIAGGGDIETDAILRAVEIEYVT